MKRAVKDVKIYGRKREPKSTKTGAWWHELPNGKRRKAK